MTDLIKRLREADTYNKKYYAVDPLHQEAADRIEAVEREWEWWRNECQKFREAWVQEKSKLAKAVEMLILCGDMFDEVAHPSDPLSVMIKTTLAELEGL